jgi:hypothetical protein
MVISVSNTGILSSNTGLLDEIGQYMTFYDEANTTLYFDATGRFPYSTSTSGTWLNLAPNTKTLVANTSALGATVANTYGPNAMIFNNTSATAGRIDRTAASNTIINPGITSGTGKMTAAVWAYNTNWYQTTQQRFVSSTQAGGWSIAINDGGFTGTTSVGAVFYNITAGGYRFMEANTRAAFTSSTGWNHLAWTFDGKNAYFYINGQVANTYTAVAATNYIDVGACLAIGAEATSNTATTSPYLSGAIASIFVSNRSFSNTEIYNLFRDTDPNVSLTGSRTYVVNSTYSTATTIAPNTPAKYYSNGALRTTGTTGFDEVSINSGSLFLANSSSSVTAPSGAGLTYTGDFCVEGWVFPISNTDGPSITLGTETTNRIVFFANTANTGYNIYGSSNVSLGNNTLVANQWNHFAFTRTSSTIRAFFNGVNTTATATRAGTLGNGPAIVGVQGNSAYLTSVRIGGLTSQYTAAFTPPKSTMIESISGTNLLLQCVNAASYLKDSSPFNATLTTAGLVSYNANSIFNYSSTGTIAAQKIYSDGTIAVYGYLDETQ